MNTGKISARYAKALFMFAEENNHEELVYNDIKTLSQSFCEVPKLRESFFTDNAYYRYPQP